MKIDLHAATDIQMESETIRQNQLLLIDRLLISKFPSDRQFYPVLLIVHILFFTIHAIHVSEMKLKILINKCKKKVCKMDFVF